MKFPRHITDAVNSTRTQTKKQPQLALNYAWQLDEQMRRDEWTQPVTVAAHGTAVPGWNSDEAGSDWRRAAPLGFSALADSSRAVGDGRPLDAAAFAWRQARGQEIPAINLVYANQALAIDTLWMHFFNKYLAYFTQEGASAASVMLSRGQGTRFDRLAAGTGGTPPRKSGPLITVLMPVFNASATLRKAVRSILGQTWESLELILLDDCSTDNSLTIAHELAALDSRIRVIALEQNRGPYVAKNIGLRSARGEYVTVHDADDWAFPTRLADQMAPLLADRHGPLKVTMGLTLRMDAEGRFTRFQQLSWFTDDGAMRWCFPSPLFERHYLEVKLGGWDSVRVGADAEIVQRIRTFEPHAIKIIQTILMLQLDHHESLTRSDQYFNDERGEAPARVSYRESWITRHAESSSLPKTGVKS